MNTIILTKEDMEKVDLYVDFSYPKFIFDKFHLVYHDEFWGVNSKVETDVELTKPYYDEKNEFWRGLIKLIKFNDIDEAKPMNYEMDYFSEDGVAFDYCGCDGGNYDRGEKIDSILAFIMRGVEDRKINCKEKEQPEKINDSNSEKVTNNTDEKIFLLKDIYKYIYSTKPDMENRKEITCPCWSVRGHYRHYKSGKVVFVENYLKGKDRKKEKPKEHKYYI